MVGLQPWTGSCFLWNDIVGLYILNISLPWQQISVLYLNFGVRSKSGIQKDVFNLPPSFTTPHHHPIYHHNTLPSPPHWKSAYYFILNQERLLFVIVFIIFLQYKMIFGIYPHYTLDLSNYFISKLILQGEGSIKWGYYD